MVWVVIGVVRFGLWPKPENHQDEGDTEDQGV
jgi:hypothetical protein